MQDKSSLGISDTFRKYIEALVEEVVINGEPFEAQKKWLRKNSEAEGINYEAIESNLTDLFEAIKELEGNESKVIERSVKLLAKECYLSEDSVNKLLTNAAAERAQKEEYKKKENEAYRKCTTIAACDNYLKDYPQGRYAQEVRSKKTQLEQEAKRKAKEDAERKAYEVRERKAKEESDNNARLLRIENGAIFCTDDTISGSLVIPSMINGERVTAIGEAAFMCCLNLTSVVIPEGVIEIGMSAFYLCTNLTSVVIPNSVVKIGYFALRECDNLSRIVIKNASLLVNTFYNKRARIEKP